MHIVRHEDRGSAMGYFVWTMQGVSSLPESSLRARLIFPRRGSRAKISLASSQTHFEVSASEFCWIPPQVKITVTGKSPICEIFVLLPDDKFRQELILENSLGSREKNSINSEFFHLKRSRWLDDLIDRYFFERIENQGTPLGCTFFLEKQILNETARLLFPQKLKTTGRLLGQEPTNLEEQISHYIATHFTEPLDLESLAKKLRVSADSLQRACQSVFGTSPINVAIEMRLSLAAELLERGEHAVADIAMLCGFSDQASFTKAFKRHYMLPPRQYQLQRDEIFRTKF